MDQLITRLSALDEEAGAVLKVVTYFDKLNEGRAGLEALVRGAAVLSGHPAGLVDPERRLALRIAPDGTPIEPAAPTPAWSSVPLLEDGRGMAWLETPDPGALAGFILDRLALSVRGALDRTRRRVVRDDAAALETVLDPTLPDPVRWESARRLGWAPDSRVRALVGVRGQSDPRFTAVQGTVGILVSAELAETGDVAERFSGRVGIGTAVPILDAPVSWRLARTAARLSNVGTPDDPGPRIVRADTLGSLADLAEAFGPATPPTADVRRLERAITKIPTLLETAYHVVAHTSIRAASISAHLHHSTLQARVAQVEQELGWDICEPFGKLRLQLALVVRKLRMPEPTELTISG